jgi:hypothetical protein
VDRDGAARVVTLATAVTARSWPHDPAAFNCSLTRLETASLSRDAQHQDPSIAFRVEYEPNVEVCVSAVAPRCGPPRA